MTGMGRAVIIGTVMVVINHSVYCSGSVSFVQPASRYGQVVHAKILSNVMRKKTKPSHTYTLVGLGCIIILLAIGVTWHMPSASEETATETDESTLHYNDTEPESIPTTDAQPPATTEQTLNPQGGSQLPNNAGQAPRNDSLNPQDAVQIQGF